MPCTNPWPMRTCQTPSYLKVLWWSMCARRRWTPARSAPITSRRGPFTTFGFRPRRAPASRQQAESVIQSFINFFQRQYFNSCCCKFYGKRNSVEMVANLCERGSVSVGDAKVGTNRQGSFYEQPYWFILRKLFRRIISVSYTHLRAHETVLDLVCRLLLEKKKTQLGLANVILTSEPKTCTRV